MRHDRIATALAAPCRVDSVSCPECDGEGEVEILALDARAPRIEDCSECDGTGSINITIKETE